MKMWIKPTVTTTADWAGSSPSDTSWRAFSLSRRIGDLLCESGYPLLQEDGCKILVESPMTDAGWERQTLNATIWT